METVAQLVQQGWDYHDTDSKRLATELESVPVAGLENETLNQFLRLATHTIGDHLRDWNRVGT